MYRYLIIGAVVVILAPFFYQLLRLLARSLGWGRSHAKKEPKRSWEDLELEKKTKRAKMPVEGRRFSSYLGIDIDYSEGVEGDFICYRAYADHLFRNRDGQRIEKQFTATGLTREEAYREMCERIDKFMKLRGFKPL